MFPKYESGVIYVGNLPYGFVEESLEDFFQQFGIIVQLRVARSSKTGKSMGFAFIQFEHHEIAEIVAETMNGYFMFNKILKCHMIPRSRFSNRLFKYTNIDAENCTKTRMRNIKIEKLIQPISARVLKKSKKKFFRKAENILGSDSLLLTNFQKEICKVPVKKVDKIQEADSTLMKKERNASSANSKGVSVASVKQLKSRKRKLVKKVDKIQEADSTLNARERKSIKKVDKTPKIYSPLPKKARKNTSDTIKIRDSSVASLKKKSEGKQMRLRVKKAVKTPETEITLTKKVGKTASNPKKPTDGLVSLFEKKSEAAFERRLKLRERKLVKKMDKFLDPESPILKKATKKTSTVKIVADKPASLPKKNSKFTSDKQSTFKEKKFGQKVDNAFETDSTLSKKNNKRSSMTRNISNDRVSSLIKNLKK